MRTNRTLLAVGTAFALSLEAFTAASASVVRKKTFDDLTREAQMIAVGRVASVESQPTADHRFAYTYVTVGELDVLKGSYQQPEITLRVAGGPLGDGRVLAVEGMPVFEPGEKVVLFVAGNGRHLCPLVGWFQGLLRVQQDPASGRELVKTSAGREISAISRGDFVVRAGPGSEDSEGFAGTPDEPSAASDRSEETTGAEGLLTLDDLRGHVRRTLAKLGASAKATEEVRSADVELSSPGDRTPKPMRRGN